MNTLVISLLVFAIIIGIFLALYAHAYHELNRAKLRQMLTHRGQNDRFIDKISSSSFLENRVYYNRVIAYFMIFLLGALIVTQNQYTTWDAFLWMGSLVVVLLLLDVLLKHLAKLNPEQIAYKTYTIYNVVSYIYIPIMVIVYLWQALIAKIIKLTESATVTEDELLGVVEEAQQDGSINEDEGDLIRSVLDFGDLSVDDIFTPRVQMVAISLDATKDEIVKKFKKTGYSRLPVYKKNVDDIVGVINYKDFYNRMVLDKTDIEGIMSKPVNVTEYMKVSDLLTLLQENKAHMAIVKDEFGGTLGIVTMEDILEELVGDIWDEHDEIIERIHKVSDYEYRVKGIADLDEVFETIGMETDDFDHTTVNGWVLESLGTMAQIGMSFTYQNLEVVVTAADDTKVLEVTIFIKDTLESEEKGDF